MGLPSAIFAIGSNMADLTCGPPRRRSSGDAAAKIRDSLREAIASIQQWASDPPNHRSPMNCGMGNHRTRRSNDVAYENDFIESSGGDFSFVDGPFLNSIGEEIDRVVAGCTTRRGFNATCGPAPSEDLSSQNSEEEMMRRLGSWGTFGTIGTHDSIETCIEENSVYLDDDGHKIDPILIEKARRKREEARALADANRAVKFEYPPISSLRQCPRPDPEDLERLFFTTEELDTYEADRRATTIVDDVEIVAVSSSASNEHVVPAPPSKAPIPTDQSVSPSKESHKIFGKYVSTPRSGRGVSISEQAEDRAAERGRQVARERLHLVRRRAPTPYSPRHHLHSFDEMDNEENLATTKTKKPLLKSVQIFLRERSVKA